MKELESKYVTIAIDAMGGSFAPEGVITGASIAASKASNCKFIFYGNEEQISSILDNYPELKEKSSIVHTDDIVRDEDKPSQVLRSGRNTSMWHTVKAVEEKRADAVVSSGNTGALMAISKILLRTLPEITRPAIVGLFPSYNNNFVMLDLGANAEGNADSLYQFAVMGRAFARVVLGLEAPKIALLNIGAEDVKGNDTVKQAAALIKESSLASDFSGFIEGNQLYNGDINVVVTDGFTGNIALKTAEGTAKFCMDMVKSATKSSIIAKIGMLIAKCALKKATYKLDHRNYNGAMFVGLNGVVVKSHGSSDHIGIANAISVAIGLAKDDINNKIIADLLP